MPYSRNAPSEYSGHGKIAEDFLSFCFEGTAEEARTAIDETVLDMGLRIDPEPQADISFKEPMGWLRRPVSLDVRLQEGEGATQVVVLGTSVGSGAGQLAHTKRVVKVFSSRVGSYAPGHGAQAARARRRWALRCLGIGPVAPLPFVVVPVALILSVSGWAAFVASAAWFCVFAVACPTCEIIRRRMVGLGDSEDLFVLAGGVVAAAAVAAFVFLAAL